MLIVARKWIKEVHAWEHAHSRREARRGQVAFSSRSIDSRLVAAHTEWSSCVAQVELQRSGRRSSASNMWVHGTEELARE